MLANGGYLVQPRLISDQNRHKYLQKYRVASTESTAYLLNLLHEIVYDRGGTGYMARVKDVDVGGKTGTSKKAEKGGYADKRYAALFAGIAPIKHPKYVVVVMIDEAQGEDYGGGIAAAPVFSSLIKILL